MVILAQISALKVHLSGHKIFSKAKYKMELHS